MGWTSVLVLQALLSAPAQAAEGRADELVEIAAGEVVDGDLYVAAERVVIEGRVEGDLWAAAQTVEVRGAVAGDLVVAAQDVEVSGAVGDDLRVASGTLAVSGTVAGDTLVAARLVAVPVGGRVGEDLVVAAYGATLEGTVGEDLLARVASFDLQGWVGGDADLRLGVPEDGEPVGMDLPAPGLTVGPGARIGGDLSYAAPEPAQVPDPAVAGSVAYERAPYLDAEGGSPVWKRVSRLLGLALVGLLLAGLAPRGLDRVAGRLQARPMASLGWGVLGVAGAFVAAGLVAVAVLLFAFVLALLTFGGLAVLAGLVGLVAEGLLLAVFAWVVGYVAPVVVAYLAGRWLLDRARPERRIGAAWAVLLGVVLYVLVASIPIVGQLLAFVVALLGFGALLHLGLGRPERREAAA